MKTRRYRKILVDEYSLAKICVDTAENEPSKVCRMQGVQNASVRGHDAKKIAIQTQFLVFSKQRRSGFIGLPSGNRHTPSVSQNNVTSIVFSAV